eukprot:jgi/Chrzof1/13860/Cz08g15100.t1
MQERLEFLRNDLTHLFDDQGIYETQYDDVVTFLDPITKYNNVQGYMFNIKMLKTAFAPKFELHDAKQTGELEITTRWTMTMEFTLSRAVKLNKWWEPVIIFTGTSIYGFNSANGKINRHIDTWDSIQNQQFFSFEAFGDFWRQLLQLYTIPNIETPHYTVLRRAADYQVRRYEPYLVAECALDPTAATATAASAPSPSSASSSTPATSTQASSSQPPAGHAAQSSVNPASAGVAAFRALAGYIFGGNAAGEKMKMTTPVFTSTQGTMQFVIGPSAHKDIASVPAPQTNAIRCKLQPGGFYAVRLFNGVATPSSCQSQYQQLKAVLLRDGLLTADDKPDDWVLARYNDPSVKPMFRLNEILLPLSHYDVWHEPKRQ